MKSVVALVGFMAVGKTMVGQSLSQRLGIPFVDLDHSIERETSRTVAEIFHSEGEEAFRGLERQALETVFRKGECVLATGGGVVLDEANRRLLREKAAVIWLDPRLEEILARLSSAEPGERPLAEGLSVGQLTEFFEGRRPFYAACAHLRVEVSGRTPRHLAGVIASLLEKMEFSSPVEER